MFLTCRDLNLKPRVYGFHRLTGGVRMRTYIYGFSVSCVRVFFATRMFWLIF